MRVASGAALAERGEPAANPLWRAREALSLGIDAGDGTCRMAPALDGTTPSLTVRAV